MQGWRIDVGEEEAAPVVSSSTPEVLPVLQVLRALVVRKELHQQEEEAYPQRRLKLPQPSRQPFSCVPQLLRTCGMIPCAELKVE